MRYFKFIFTFLMSYWYLNLNAFSLAIVPKDQYFSDQHPWSVLYYYGQTVNAPLIQVVTLTRLPHWPEHIQSLEASHTLSSENSFRRLMYPLVGVVALAFNTTLRQGDQQHTIYEFNPYVVFRFITFPWNNYVNTTFAIGEGLSYDTSISAIEKRNNDNTKRLLNYLMFEATFAAPQYPEWQLIFRVHHRSGAFGLYHAGNTGSNDIGLGIRYSF